MNMSRKVKLLFLKGSKTLGLFRLSKVLTKHKLRILCYHNFASTDKITWDSGMTIDPKTFKERMDYLAVQGHTVLSLDDAVNKLYSNALPYLPTVITIDDGWYNIKKRAHEVLRSNSFPYTIYVSSHYSKRQIPLFNFVVHYLFSQTKETTINLDELGTPLSGTVNLSDKVLTEKAIEQIIDYGHSKLGFESRYKLIPKVAKLLNVNFESMDKNREFHFLSAKEIEELSAEGVDIQLHSYRHCWPKEKEAALKELRDDKAYLEPLVGKETNHFCYPSGVWSKEQFPYLIEAKIKSATTCIAGLNDSLTHKFALKRFLDSDSIHFLEFDAEMSGYLEIIRKLRKKTRDARKYFTKS